MIEIDYNISRQNMDEKPPIARYFERVYLAWINTLGQVKPQSEFAALLGMDRQRFNNYYNGRRAELDYQTALRICQFANSIGLSDPYELMDILNYPIPSDNPFAGMPPELESAVQAALNAIRLKTGAVKPGSKEYWRIAAEELSKIDITPKQ